MVEVVCSSADGERSAGGAGSTVKSGGNNGTRSAQEASVLDQPLAISNMTVSTALGRLRRARSLSKPTAMVGFKEWIFSHKAGALGSFAAAAEYVFASVLQMNMASGNVRLHYGHPDVFDKLHCITRVSVLHPWVVR